MFNVIPPSYRKTPIGTACCGAFAGGVSVVLFQGIDVVKSRMQGLQASRYRNAFHCTTEIVKNEGFLALYKGVLPNMQRAIAVNGPGIAAFDHSKHLVGRLLGEEGSFRARFMASLVGGVVTALVGTPFDTMKTRMMNQPAGQPLYASTAHCAMATVRAPPARRPLPSSAAATARLPPPLHALSRARARSRHRCASRACSRCGRGCSPSTAGRRPSTC